MPPCSARRVSETSGLQGLRDTDRHAYSGVGRTTDCRWIWILCTVHITNWLVLEIQGRIGEYHIHIIVVVSIAWVSRVVR